MEKIGKVLLFAISLFFLFFLFSLQVVEPYYRINDNSLLIACICSFLALFHAFLFISLYHKHFCEFLAFFTLVFLVVLGCWRVVNSIYQYAMAVS